MTIKVAGYSGKVMLNRPSGPLADMGFVSLLRPHPTVPHKISLLEKPVVVFRVRMNPQVSFGREFFYRNFQYF